MSHEILQEFMFADQRFFVFFLLGINFCDLQKVLDKSLIMFLILLRTCNGNTYFQYEQYFGVCTLSKTSKQMTFLCQSITNTGLHNFLHVQLYSCVENLS